MAAAVAAGAAPAAHAHGTCQATALPPSETAGIGNPSEPGFLTGRGDYTCSDLHPPDAVGDYRLELEVCLETAATPLAAWVQSGFCGMAVYNGRYFQTGWTTGEAYCRVTGSQWRTRATGRVYNARTGANVHAPSVAYSAPYVALNTNLC